jgi:hypothetical protein
MTLNRRQPVMADAPFLAAVIAEQAGGGEEEQTRFRMAAISSA